MVLTELATGGTGAPFFILVWKIFLHFVQLILADSLFCLAFDYIMHLPHNIDHLGKAFLSIADNPLIGKACDSIRFG